MEMILFIRKNRVLNARIMANRLPMIEEARIIKLSDRFGGLVRRSVVARSVVEIIDFTIIIVSFDMGANRNVIKRGELTP